MIGFTHLHFQHAMPISPEGINMNSRGCKPTEQQTAPLTPKGSNFGFRAKILLKPSCRWLPSLFLPDRRAASESSTAWESARLGPQGRVKRARQEPDRFSSARNTGNQQRSHTGRLSIAWIKSEQETRRNLQKCSTSISRIKTLSFRRPCDPGAGELRAEYPETTRR